MRTYLFDDVAAAKTIGNNEKVYLGIKRIQKTMRRIEMLKKYTGAFLFRWGNCILVSGNIYANRWAIRKIRPPIFAPIINCIQN